MADVDAHRCSRTSRSRDARSGTTHCVLRMRPKGDSVNLEVSEDISEGESGVDSSDEGEDRDGEESGGVEEPSTALMRIMLVERVKGDVSI